MTDFNPTQTLRWNGGDLERLWTGTVHVNGGFGFACAVAQQEWRRDPDYQTLLRNGWLPIDTAPTDIGQVLVWGTAHNQETGACWLARSVEGVWQHGPLRIDATHWMAVAPPRADGA